MKNIVILTTFAVAMISMLTTGMTTSYAQVPEHCGYSFEHRCVVEDEEEMEKILEVFPDAQVEVNEELYESIPEEDREDAEGIIESGARESDDEESSESDEDSGDSGSSSQPQSNFQPIPPGQQGLPPAQQSGAGLNDACLKSGFSQEKCNNMLFSDNPGGYCSTLKMVGLDCPKIQDPSFTFGNPEAARQQSEQQIENTERAIQGFERLNPPGSLGGQFAGPGSTTNRPGQ
jgi:hypothetical protein